jgi:NAD dependent epimerase/dehydratase family enzyme
VLKKELGRPIAIPVPSFFLRLALGEMATALFRSERSAPQRLQQMGFTFRFPGVGPALRDLIGTKR